MKILFKYTPMGASKMYKWISDDKNDDTFSDFSASN